MRIRPASAHVGAALRIGVVTTSYPRHPGDHAGSFVAAHVQAMRMLGHHVDVVGTHEIKSSLFTGAGAPDELERGRGYIRGAIFTGRLAAAIAKRAHDWDLIIAHWLVPALAALPARKPLLAIAHGGDVHTLRRLHLLAPTLHLLRGAKLAFVSEELRAIANAHEAIVQPMGLDVDHFARLERNVQTPRDVEHNARPQRNVAELPLVVIVARLVAIKGVDVLLAALPHVRKRIAVMIAGDGPERARLQRSAPANVTFLGAVDAATRDELLRKASVVVVPSRVLPNGRTEGMPMIALEALATGVPVVASAVGGLASLQSATRVRHGDPFALAAAIDRVLASPPNEGALRASVAHLAWPRVAQRLLAHAGCEAGDTSRRRTA
jgi:glycosyltransferase involved in cell wall biosynthesis